MKMKVSGLIDFPYNSFQLSLVVFKVIARVSLVIWFNMVFLVLICV
jgi:hypothetical protein